MIEQEKMRGRSSYLYSGEPGYGNFKMTLSAEYPSKSSASHPGEIPLQWIRADPELARLAIVLNLASQLRLWLIARHISTQRHGGRGWIEIETFERDIEALDLVYTHRHFRRLLTTGEGIFWRVSYNRINLIGVQNVSYTLTAKASLNTIGLVNTNRPGGMKDIFLPVKGQYQQWEAYIYAGWLAARENLTISRATLAKLFNRTAKTLRRWENMHLSGIVIRTPSYAQVDDPQDYDIPEHSQPYSARIRKPGSSSTIHYTYYNRVRWQLPSTYTSTMPQHNRKGQSRKVRTAAKRAGLQPPDLFAGGLPNRNPRRYFESGKTLSETVKKHGASTPRYLFLGKNRHNHNIFEPSTHGFARTRPNERAPKSVEQRQIKQIQGRIAAYCEREK